MCWHRHLSDGGVGGRVGVLKSSDPTTRYTGSSFQFEPCSFRYENRQRCSFRRHSKENGYQSSLLYPVSSKEILKTVKIGDPGSTGIIFCFLFSSLYLLLAGIFLYVRNLVYQENLYIDVDIHFSSNHTDAELQFYSLLTKRNPIACLCCIPQEYYIFLILFLLEVFFQCTLIMFFFYSNSLTSSTSPYPLSFMFFLSLSKNKQLKNIFLLSQLLLCVFCFIGPPHMYTL